MKKGLNLEQMNKAIIRPAWKALGFLDLLPWAIAAVYHQMNKK